MDADALAKAQKEAEEAARKAIEAAGGTVPDEPKKDEPKDGSKDGPKDPPKDRPKDPVKADAPKDPPKDAAIVNDPPPRDPPGGGSGSETARKREAISKALAEDPSFLTKDSTLDRYKVFAKCQVAQRDNARDKLRDGRKVPSAYTDTPLFIDYVNALVITNCKREIDALHAAINKR
jgi:hypothetical protein